MILVYVATNKTNGKKYVGVTNNLNRRLAEHKVSKYSFGIALREYGVEAFTFDVIEFETKEDAYDFEGLMIGREEMYSDQFYNMMCGGVINSHYGDDNCMRNPETLKNHPSLFTKENNPMNDPEAKAKMIKSQALRAVIVEGVKYYGVREAARSIGVSRQCLVYRLKSNNFPDYSYHSG